MRSSLLLLGCLGSLVTAFAVGCGSEQDANKDVFDCKTSGIANGSVTVCEHVGATEPGKYECGASSTGTGSTGNGGSLSLRNVSITSDGVASSSRDCPAGTVPQTQQPPVSGDSTQVDVDANGNGDSSSSTTPPVNGDGVGSQGSSGAPPVGTEQTGSNGPSGPPSGGGYTCESDGTKTTCTSTACEAGYTPGANGTCVPSASTPPVPGDSTGALGCSLTQGYWKNHANKWPVTSLALGGKTYSQAELLKILGTPTTGDASIILAHQLIAALLNTKNGASASSIAATITQAQAWLSANGTTLPYGISTTSTAGSQAVALAKTLDDYNNGRSGIPHCD